MSAYREISETFLNSLKNGELSKLTELVKNPDNNLILCFRNGYINVYYMSHSILKITEKPKGYSVEFNMGHGRYSGTVKDVCEKLNKVLKELPLNTQAREKPVGCFTYVNNKQNMMRFTIPKENKSFHFESLVHLYKEFVDDFFDKNKTKDFYQDKERPDKKELTEKRHQQKLFTKNLSLSEKYVFVDMELSIPGNLNAGAPDCLALRLEQEIVKAVVLVEVKSTKKSCEGKNSIRKHNKDFEKIIQNEKYKKDIRNTLAHILKYYQELGILPGDSIQFPDDVEFEKLFVFTTKKACDWAEQNLCGKDSIACQGPSKCEKLYYEWS